MGQGKKKNFRKITEHHLLSGHGDRRASAVHYSIRKGLRANRKRKEKRARKYKCPESPGNQTTVGHLGVAGEGRKWKEEMNRGRYCKTGIVQPVPRAKTEICLYGRKRTSGVVERRRENSQGRGGGG